MNGWTDGQMGGWMDGWNQATAFHNPPILDQHTQERRRYEDMADLYSIIKATEHLEAAFARDAVGQDDVCVRPFDDG